jgi:hypothetical protein
MEAPREPVPALAGVARQVRIIGRIPAEVREQATVILVAARLLHCLSFIIVRFRTQPPLREMGGEREGDRVQAIGSPPLQLAWSWGAHHVALPSAARKGL